MSEEEFRSTLQERMLGVRPNNYNSQRVISVDEIETYVEEGWEFVSELSNGKIVVKKVWTLLPKVLGLSTFSRRLTPDSDSSRFIPLSLDHAVRELSSIARFSTYDK